MLADLTYNEAIERSTGFMAGLVSAGMTAEEWAAVAIPGRTPPMGLVSASTDPDAVLRSVWRGDPGRFWGLYPALFVPEPTIGGTPTADELFLPGVFDFDIQAVYPNVSSTPGGDGRLEAQEKTRLAMEAFLVALEERRFDSSLGATSVEHVGSSSGDIDRMGGGRVNMETHSLLWINRATIRVRL